MSLKRNENLNVEKIVTFGAPRVGDQVFCNDLKSRSIFSNEEQVMQITQYKNELDIVPHLPFIHSERALIERMFPPIDILDKLIAITDLSAPKGDYSDKNLIKIILNILKSGKLNYAETGSPELLSMVEIVQKSISNPFNFTEIFKSHNRYDS